jgi:hypothetical protein
MSLRCNGHEVCPDLSSMGFYHGQEYWSNSRNASPVATVMSNRDLAGLIASMVGFHST